jgi:hypothetical protein
MDLSKTQILDLIHKRLGTVATSLKALDDAYAKESNIQAELVKLRAVETDFIASEIANLPNWSAKLSKANEISAGVNRCLTIR